MCQYEHLTDGKDSIWCRFFDSNILKTIEYREDIKYHCKYGYKYEISRLMACDLVNNLLITLKSIQTEQRNASKINIYFTHSSTMLTFFSVFGIGNSTSNFDFENIEVENKKRTYRISWMDPMNSNIAFVLYKCNGDDQTRNKKSFKLRVFHNENLIKLNGCTSIDCNLENFLDFYSQFISKCKSSQSVCQLK